MAANSIFLHLCIFATAILVHGQSQAGYISIDCGAPPNINYIDTYTGISYTSDGGFISTGVNMKVSTEYGYPANPVLPFPLADVRAFPHGNRNCYSLNPADGKGNLYLIRASFMYGNYDGKNTLPEFDLYVNVNFWSSVRFRNASEDVIREIISFAELDTIYVCLVNKGMGTPFISALELRPLNNSIYGTEFGRNVSLVLYQRWDTGYLIGTGRYKDDIYDRIWSPYNMSASWASTLASAPVDIYQTGYKVPVEVIETAASPIKDNDPLELKWTSDDPYARFYSYLHFAELKALKKTDKREIKIFWNGSPVSGAFVPTFLVATTISTSRAFTGNDHLISIQKTSDSTLPPILNAIEIFTAQQLTELSTATEDVSAIQSIRFLYRVKKIWTGDPCSPRQYPWEGLQCSYNNSLPPRIVSLNLSSSELHGPIAFCIGNLSVLESLDLSNNSLIGPVPEFLDDLKRLKFLNLKGNKLTGFISASLVKRSKAGVLTLRVDGQNLCRSSSCQNKNNMIVPAVVATLVSALLIILVIGWFLRRQRKEAYSGPLLPSSKRRFSPTEVSNITSNFHNVIGRGGFGVVYLGHLEDGTEVAVKMINDTSSEKSKGSSTRVSKEFQMEAELLLTVHHRNLASFIGYCDGGRKMALIYEYMSNGNLEDYLAGEKAEKLSWEMRLRIAIEAAQGLEYLHHGCKPPIIHRDVKTANILLSQELDAKIADFGLSKVFPTDDESHVVTAVMGTPGYVDPEYYNTFKLNEKSDVYSLGIVLLELITGQPAIMTTDNGDKINVIRMVEPYIKAGYINNIVDQRLRRDFGINSAWKYLEVAMWCIRERGSQRPTMNQIVTELKHCLAVELDTDHQQQRYRTEDQIKPSYGGNEYDSSGSMSRRYEDYSSIAPTAR